MQASTTVYLAAYQGGMTILSREPHSMAVSYTEYGKDATVSDTRGREIDFSFRNESGGTVYLAAHVIGSGRKNLQCEVRLYGPSLNGHHLRAGDGNRRGYPKAGGSHHEGRRGRHLRDLCG